MDPHTRVKKQGEVVALAEILPRVQQAIGVLEQDAQSGRAMFGSSGPGALLFLRWASEQLHDLVPMNLTTFSFNYASIEHASQRWSRDQGGGSRAASSKSWSYATFRERLLTVNAVFEVVCGLIDPELVRKEGVKRARMQSRGDEAVDDRWRIALVGSHLLGQPETVTNPTWQFVHWRGKPDHRNFPRNPPGGKREFGGETTLHASNAHWLLDLILKNTDPQVLVYGSMFDASTTVEVVRRCFRMEPGPHVTNPGWVFPRLVLLRPHPLDLERLRDCHLIEPDLPSALDGNLAEIASLVEARRHAGGWAKHIPHSVEVECWDGLPPFCGYLVPGDRCRYTVWRLDNDHYPPVLVTRDLDSESLHNQYDFVRFLSYIHGQLKKNEESRFAGSLTPSARR